MCTTSTLYLHFALQHRNNDTGYFTTHAETRVTRLGIDLFNKKTNKYEDLHGVIDFGYLEREIEEQLTEAAYE